MLERIYKFNYCPLNSEIPFYRNLFYFNSENVLIVSYIRKHLGIRIYAGSDHTTQGWHTDDIVFYQHPGAINQTLSDGTVKYNPENDIAMIILKTPINWDKFGHKEGIEEMIINTICLPQREDSPNNIYDVNPYRKATFFGWGRDLGNEPPTILQRANLQVKHRRERTGTLFQSYVPNYEERACKVIYLEFTFLSW